MKRFSGCLKRVLGPVIRFFAFLLPHLTVVLALMTVTFFVIDRFNDAMAFLNNGITKILVLILSLFALIFAVCEIVRRHKK